MNIDLNNLNDSIKNFVQEIQENLKEDIGVDAVEQLSKALNSGEAIEFTNRMNEMFKSKNAKDDDGNFIQIERPVNISSKMIWDIKGEHAKFTLTEAEDQWFRADALYGSNILQKLGFKYTNI